MVKYYKRNVLIKLFTILGGFAGLMYCLYQISTTTQIESWFEIFGFGRFVRNLIGMIVAALTILAVLKPDDPLPWHWLLLLTFGILLFVFSWLMSAILVLLGAVFGLIEDI
jgi:ABC-type polysaccharide/polyol phosphate export permease